MTRRAKILIVDDDELALEITTTKLSDRYDIVSTQDPGNVLRLARETEPLAGSSAKATADSSSVGTIRAT